MRHSFKYYGFSQQKILKVLLNMSMSNTIDYLSLLISNTDHKLDLPSNYINYEIIAGVGLNDMLISNNDSFSKLFDFHSQKEDWLFGYLSYDLKNELVDLN